MHCRNLRHITDYSQLEKGPKTYLEFSRNELLSSISSSESAILAKAFVSELANRAEPIQNILKKTVIFIGNHSNLHSKLYQI